MQRSEHVPPLTKFMYGFGDITNSLLNTIVAVYFLFFLTDVVKLSPGLAAVAIFVGKSFDWINDPLIGHLSDRTRSRWGRRRPFLLFGLAPLAVAFALFFWVPPLQSEIWLAVYYSFLYMIYDTAATFVYMPYYALTPELTLDYDERTSLTTVRMLFSIAGGLIAFTTPSLITDSFADTRMGYFVMAMVFGSVGVIPLLATFWGTRERPEHIAQPQPSLRESLTAASANRPFIFGLFIFLFTWATIDLIQAVLLYFIIHWLQMGHIKEIIMGSVFISAAAFLPLWSWVPGRWDKRRAYIVGMAFLAATMMVLIFIQPGTPLPIVLAITILAGVGVSAAHVIPQAILPDAIEVDELRTGQRHEGMFYSLVMLAQKVASSIAVPLAGAALEIAQYNPDVAVQPESALWAIRGLTGIVPTILLAVGIIFAWRYPLSREEHTNIRQRLTERHVEIVADK